MEDSSQELIAEGNRYVYRNVRRRKLVDELVENDSCTEREVTTASKTRSNTTSVSKKPAEQCGSTVTKKKSTAQKPKLNYHF